MLKYDWEKPLAARWLPLRGTDKVARANTLLDRLEMTDVVWSPYASHRELKSFNDQTLYSSYLSVGIYMWSYLSERVLR